MILQAPNNIPLEEFTLKPGLFLAGGISNCEDWQSYAANKFENHFHDRLLIVNPRRDVYEYSPEVAIEQIRWEHLYMSLCRGVIFWFLPPTENPITLFELGKELGKFNKDLWIGCHPDYNRKLDVKEQVSLETRQYHSFYDSLDTMIESAIDWIEANRND